MNIKKIIGVLYLAYTFYILLVVDSTSLTFFGILPALMILWLTYFMYYVGYSVVSRSKEKFVKTVETKEVWLFSGNQKKLVLLALLSIICSVLAGRYYTGQTPMSMFENLKNGVSLYAEYQRYFVEQQRAVLSLTKIPHILMMFFIQALMFYSYCSIVAKQTRFKKGDIIYLLVVTLSFAYFGIVRGTNFEIFEIGMLVIYVLLSKVSFSKSRKLIMTLIKVIVSIFVLLSLYSLVLKLRGFTTYFNISRDVFYDEHGVFPTISPLTSFLVIMLYGYFGHGFNYIAVYINKVWFTSLDSLVAGFLPSGHTLMFGDSLHYRVSSVLDMGVMWQPDNAWIISSLGFLGIIMIPFLLGVVSTITDKKNEPVSYLMQFMIMLQMLSMPVGHFIFTSSSNMLILFSLLLYWFWRKMIKVKIKF